MADPHQRRTRRRPRSRPQGEDRALCREPHRPQIQRPHRGRPRPLRQTQGADGHHLARRPHRRERRHPLLWRHRPARHHQHRLRAQGAGEGRRRPDCGLHRRRRPRRHPLALRPHFRNPPVLRRPARPLRRNLERRAGLGRAGHGGRFRLYRLRLHTHPRSPRRRRLQGHDRRQRREGYRLLKPVHRRPRQLPRALHRESRHGSQQPPRR